MSAVPVAGSAIIAGIGQTELSKESGRSELQLAAEAAVHVDRSTRAGPVVSSTWHSTSTSEN